MESYKDFAMRNQCWDSYYTVSDFWAASPDKDPMRRNYAIAKSVAKEFYRHYDWASASPQVGDIVEYCNGWHVYENAQIAEPFSSRASKYNLLNVCENGSSWTDGKTFSTSGGAFHEVHASRFALVGPAKVRVWTWGCHGPGASQGIYFTLNVRKWIVRHDEPTAATFVRIGKGQISVESNDGSGYAGQTFCQSFDSARAFLAWAEYIGFEFEHIGRLAKRRGFQTLEDVYVNSMTEVPEGAKPLHLVSNGEVVLGWVKKEGNSIRFFIPTISSWERGCFGEHLELTRQQKLEKFWKYSMNPLGV